MSLQVWLPLTKDLRQQGISSVIATNSGATYSSTGGKLGGCYNFTTSSYQKIGFPYSLANYTEFTVCVWVKPISTTITGCLFTFVNPNDYWQFVITNGNNVGIRDNSTGETGSRKEYTLGSFVANTWTHLAISYDKGVVKIYKDGVLFSTNNTGGSAMNNYSGTNAAIGESMVSSSSYYFAGGVNDFRIYDHCLSPMEIKWLSQGLVLHYPLNRNGWGQENLLKNSGYFTSTTGWTNNQNVTVSVDNNELKAVMNQTTSTPGVKTTTTIDFSAGTYTLSALIKSEGGNRVDIPYPFYLNNGTALYNGVYQKKVQHGDYIYYEAIITFSEAKNGTTLYILGSGPNNGETWHIKWVKVERGSIATPWCPNSSDVLATTMGLNSTTEYDCSGFCNNGTKMTDTIAYTSDTAKYAVSTNFNGTYDGILIENLVLSDIINSAVTYAFWIKPNGENGARSVYFGSYNTGSSWSIEKTAGNVMRSYWNGSPDETCSGATITDGVWQHVCITKNGTSDIKVYINGVQKWASTATHSNLSFPTTYRIGRDTRSNDGTPYKGLMCDFRIYATALSASDVKSLYQNCATIDPDGTIRGQIRS